MARCYLLAAVLSLGLLASGCRERNPAYVQKVESKDAPAGQDTKVEPPAEDGGLSDAPVLPVDTLLADEPVAGEEVGPDVPAAGVEVGVVLDVAGVEITAHDTQQADRPVDVATDTVPGKDVPRDQALPETRDAADAPPPIVDGTADVVEAAADLTPVCSEGTSRSCASPGNPLIGACRAGKQLCTSNAWGACKEEVLPAADEKCNGIDDNCNGMTDEGCVEECVVVAVTGDDNSADGTAAKPFASLEAALAFAGALDGGGPLRVCVAGGATCADAKAYDFDASLLIPNGARVQGNYALSEGTLTYCPATQPPVTALRFKAEGASLAFDDSVTAATEVSGFVIERFSASTPIGVDSVSTAVKVKGGRNVTLSGIFVTDTPAAATTYGVQVEGGQVTIVGSAIGGGGGEQAAIGVYVNGGSVSLRNNCDAVAKGICTTACDKDGAVLGIRGRTAAATTDAMAATSAVFIAAGSPATSTIVANMLCGGGGKAEDATLGTTVAALRCESGACATVAGNDITGGSGRLALAASLAGGGGTIESNAIRAGCGTVVTTGVLLGGSSARLRNNRIVGSECEAGAATGTFYGVRLVHSSGSEPELHSNDIDAFGVAGECQSVGLAVERTSGSGTPAGIVRNNIIAAGDCKERVAVYEGENASLRVIENNDLYPGLASANTSVLYRRGNTNAGKAADINALAGAKANISADPKYVAYPRDLHLTKDSPCIDQGTAEGAPATDADGAARPRGAGFDIGAYEFASP
jgi:hypothetical protein